jgi:hypothetical protein
MRTTTAMLVALAAAVLAAFPATSTAAAESACQAIGGIVGPDQTCHSHTDNARYKLDFSFPVDYPDQAALAGFLTQRRDDFIDWVSDMRPTSVPGELDVIGDGYRSGASASGTKSLVLTIGNQAGVHPVTSYKAFNYNLGAGVPITFETLFRPGTQPREVLDPIVQRALDKRGATGNLTLDDLGANAYENFAITDDAVIFFFDQDGLLPHERGPLTVDVPRTELAALLA